MVPADLDYVRRLTVENVITGPVLELGTGYGGDTSRGIIEAAGIQYFGTDLRSMPGVDFAADFERSEDMQVFRSVAPFGAVLILNVLEHTFDPIRILDNAASLVRAGGSLVVLTPAIWPLHNFPMDAWRVLPNFYEEYAARRNFSLVIEYFEYVGLGPVRSHKNPDGSYAFPPPSQTPARRLMGRAIHKAFNTFGRAMFHPSHVAVGAVIRIGHAQPDVPS